VTWARRHAIALPLLHKQISALHQLGTRSSSADVDTQEAREAVSQLKYNRFAQNILTCHDMDANNQLTPTIDETFSS